MILIIMLIGLQGAMGHFNDKSVSSQADSTRSDDNSIQYEVAPIFTDTPLVRCAGRWNRFYCLPGIEMGYWKDPLNIRLGITTRRNELLGRRLIGHQQWGDLKVLQWDMSAYREESRVSGDISIDAR
jgi:hypothetical protein